MVPVEWLLPELRQAVRKLAARPAFTVGTLTILSVGIGASTAVFGLAHTILFRPLPYPHSEAIVTVGQIAVGHSGAQPILSGTELLRLWDEAHSFEQLAAVAPLPVVLRGPAGPTNLFAAEVSPSLFPLLGATPHHGRLLAEPHGLADRNQLVVLSHRTWTNWFGSDPDIVDTSVRLNDEPYVVAGVLAAGFEFEDIAVWLPLVVQPDPEPVDGGVVMRSAFRVIGRLRPGVSPSQAATEVQTILNRAADERPLPSALELETRVTPLRKELTRFLRMPLLMLAGAAGLVLLLTCANVAGLLLARGIARRRELAVRAALGATRGAIVHKLLTESVVLSVAGGLFGLGVTAVILRAASGLVPLRLAEVSVDGTVLAFATGLSVVSGVLLGTVPALAWSRVDVVRSLTDAGAPLAGAFALRTNTGHAVLAIAQIALAFALLTAAGLLLRSFVAFITFDIGFDPANVVVARADEPPRLGAFGGGGARLGPDQIAALNAAARNSTGALLVELERVGSLRGVEAVALASRMPLAGAGSRPIEVAGRPAPSDPRERLQAGIREVTPGYAQVLGLRLLVGRFFDEGDVAGSRLVAMVSESFAREAFGGAKAAVGQRLALPAFPFTATERDGDSWRQEAREIVGVVADVGSPFQTVSALGPAHAGDVYFSILQPAMDQMPFFGFTRPIVAVRTESDPLAVVPFLRDVLADAYPDAIIDATPLETMLSAQTAQPRFYAVCAGIFAGIALLLAAIGLYSLLSYTTSQRRRDFGVRMALGAGSRAVLTLVFKQTAVVLGAGLVIGLLAAAVAARVVESVLFGVTPADPLTLASVTVVLLATGLVACWCPARRSTGIDPMDVLREE